MKVQKQMFWRGKFKYFHQLVQISVIKSNLSTMSKNDTYAQIWKLGFDNLLYDHTSLHKILRFHIISYQCRINNFDYKLKTYSSQILFYSPVPVSWDMQAYRFSENLTIIKPMTVLNTENKNSKGRKRKQALGMLNISQYW